MTKKIKKSKNKLINCPICESSKADIILDLNCGNLDRSALYQYARIKVCAKCGHIHNSLSPKEIDGLLGYYNEEWAPLNLSFQDKGDRSGSNKSATVKKYSRLYRIISSHVRNSYRILDVGCASGGFLDYLKKQGFNNLYGIDVVRGYVREAKKKGNYNIKLGSAEKIPFVDDSFDLVIADQLVEHLVRPAIFFREAKRVLTNDGLLCVSIPNAHRYKDTYFFDFFWFLIREHIQHFDIRHLKLLAASEGFELLAYSEYKIAMTTEKMILPVLTAVFHRTGIRGGLKITDDCFKLKRQIKSYMVSDSKKLDKKRRTIGELITSQKPTYVWGIGREFLYLYESCGLKNCNLAGLIDVNPYKRKAFSVGSRRIMDKFILREAAPDSALIISAIAHTESIKKELREINYRGKIVNI